MTVLHPRIESELRDLLHALTVDGSLLSATQLQGYYAAFRREFGPEALRALDGQQLLERMHDHGNRNGLVYWLEFKNDEIFPARFGSIAGGSALKFGVYRRAESGTWATKGIGSSPKDIPLAEAIEIARVHRDQLLAASDVLAALSDSVDDRNYLTVQRDLSGVAPDVQDTVWGHKYLSLLFPEKLDDFHNASFQRYQLARLLQMPPRDGDNWAEGRYVCGGRFVALSRYLDLPLNTLTTLLNRRHGPPRSYWRLGTTDDVRSPRKFWPSMRDRDILALGWPLVGDLSAHSDKTELKTAIAELLRKHYADTPKTIGMAANQLAKFVMRFAEGDRVVVTDGALVLGVGEVAGPYSFDPSSPFPHQRPVRWRSLAEWNEVDAESRRGSTGTIKDPPNQVEIERHILDDATSTHIQNARATQVSEASPTASSRAHTPLARLNGILGLVQEVLERKGQVVLYGPPGTGKTYWALRGARDLAAHRAFGVSYADLRDEQRSRIGGDASGTPALVRVTSFHPEYGYEDFIEGYRPHAAPDGSLSFAVVPGIFRRICSDAAAAPHHDFYLVIDEINRGDIPRIFGELLTLLERDKRGEQVVLPASGERFCVPSNVYVLGTMNTADRSIALLDVALRRRFGFTELMPDYSLLAGTVIGGLPLGAWLEDLNGRVRVQGGGDGRNRQIGHAFFLGAGGRPITTVEQLAAVLRDDIVPLLQEYSYDDFSQLQEMLGSGLVDTTAQRIKYELFDQNRGSELIAALLRPEIATATAAVIATATEAELSENEESSDEGRGVVSPSASRVTSSTS
jgi:5-methylcytosine-specific restriction enzyme B